MLFSKNISGELTQEVLSEANRSKASSISLVNTHASTTCTIDVYIEKKLTGKFYLAKNVALPIGVTLVLDGASFFSGFGLFTKLTKSNTFALTGTIDPIASATVTGVGTLFLTEVAIGDEIIVSGETRTVQSITSNTVLVVTSAFSNNANDTTPDCSPKPNVDIIIN